MAAHNLAMTGTIIENTNIAVDYWNRKDDAEIYFLTHCHDEHVEGLTSTWTRKIYTSPFNVWYLENKLKINKSLLVPLDLESTYLLLSPETKEKFVVTVIDANHCPGSVMFLFRGNFGTILYTGNMRYTPEMKNNEELDKVVNNKALDVVYLDNTYASPNCVFPTRQEILSEIVQIVRNHPNHHIVIGLRKLGKEEVLRTLALELKERVCVSENRLSILQQLEYEDVFTVVPDESRIHAVYGTTVCYAVKERKKHQPTIGIILSSLHRRENIASGIYVLPYNDHSSCSELMEFVSYLKPAAILPVVKSTVYRANNSKLSMMIRNYSTIPQQMLNLCRKRTSEDSEIEMCISLHEFVPVDVPKDSMICVPSKLSHTRKRRAVMYPVRFHHKGVDYQSSVEAEGSKDILAPVKVTEARSVSLAKLIPEEVQCEEELVRGEGDEVDEEPSDDSQLPRNNPQLTDTVRSHASDSRNISQLQKADIKKNNDGSDHESDKSEVLKKNDGTDSNLIHLKQKFGFPCDKPTCSKDSIISNAVNSPEDLEKKNSECGWKSWLESGTGIIDAHLLDYERHLTHIKPTDTLLQWATHGSGICPDIGSILESVNHLPI